MFDKLLLAFESQLRLFYLLSSRLIAEELRKKNAAGKGRGRDVGKLRLWISRRRYMGCPCRILAACK
jgi:hypothetical protein